MTDQTLARITWQLDAYAGFWLPLEELTAVTDWMADNRLERATAARAVLVENGTVTYGLDRSGVTVRSRHRDIVMTTVPLLSAPPTVYQPDCTQSELSVLQAVFSEHEWSCAFDGVCVDCSAIQTRADGRIWCHRADAATWPCEPVRRALAVAGMPVPPPAGDNALRRLGDCLDPVDNAMVFGRAA